MGGLTQKALLYTLCGVAMVLVGPAMAQEEAAPTVRFSVQRFEVTGENPLSAEATQSVLAPYLGEHAGVEGLLSAARALEDAIQREGVSFHRVVLRPQQLKSGVVTLAVVVYAVSKVTVRGNKYFSEENIRRSLPGLREGGTPNTRRLARSLSVANEHPAKEVTLTFKDSETTPNALDADVRVKDSKPWQVFGALSNTGTAVTGPWRLTLGASHGNLFGLDHAGVVSYTTSPGHASQVQQYGGSYYAPVYPLGGALSAYYVSSDVATGQVANQDLSGRGQFAGLRYSHTLLRRGRLSHKLSVGVDDKLFENDLVFGATNLCSDPLPFPRPCADVRSRPLTLQYAGTYEAKDWQANLHVGYVRNIPSGGGNTGETYSINRPGADVTWDLLRAGGNLTYPLGRGWAARAIVDGQYANEALIPGEQFGLGGAGSVRGLDERQVTGDDGVRVSLEAWSPPVMGGLQFLGFVDAGRVSLKTPLVAGQSLNDRLLSAGVGALWRWREYVIARFDVAYVIEGTSQGDALTAGIKPRDEEVRGHFNLVVRY
jgi:hemolysin activation/secretion protein